MEKATKVTNSNFQALLKKPGRYRVERGLSLRVDDPGRAYWLSRYRIAGVERVTSLGSAWDVNFAEARKKHLAVKHTVEVEGRDPTPMKGKAAAEPAVAVTASGPSGAPSFAAAAAQYLEREEGKGNWKNPKHRQQWRNTLMGLPKAFLDSPTDRIDRKAVHAALAPIWDAKPETARRLLGRIAKVLDFARGPDDDRRNPAAWEGWLKDKLGEQSKTKLDRTTGERIPRGNHAAMSWRDVPAFVAKLRTMDSTAAAALEFLILTASRTAEVIGATWEEIGDLDTPKPVWTVPAARMKMDRPHSVPLSGRAVEILETMKARRSSGAFGDHPFVFAGDRPRRGLSNMAFLMLLRRMKTEGVTAHGFRSSFRSWCADTGVAFEVAEQCLAHAAGNAVVAAYQRSSLLERRRPVMEQWARFCAGEEMTGEVVPFEKRAAE